MSDALSELPIKSLELPTKTVSKLKPLGVRTIAQLYAVPLAQLVALGLTPKELDELADAAPDFGVAWHEKTVLAEAVKATASAPPLKPGHAASKASPAAGKVKGQKLSAEEQAALAPFSRVRTVRAASIGGPERWYAVALVDVSRLPEGQGPELEKHLLVLADRFGALLEALGRKRGHGHQVIGAALVFPLLAWELPRLQRLAEAHAQATDDAPVFAGRVPPSSLLAAAAGLLAAELHADAIALTPGLLELARGLATPSALQALGFIADAYAGAGREKEGLDRLRPLLTPPSLSAVTHPAGALLGAAALAVQGGDATLAISVLRRAFEVDRTPVHLQSLRGAALDDARLSALFGRADFRALYRGFPAWLARLDGST